MRVMVFEPHHAGHHFMFLKHLLPAIIRLGIKPALVTTKSAAASPEFTGHLFPLRSQLELDTSVNPEPAGSVAPARHRLAELSAAICRHQAEHIFVPNADGLVQWMGVVSAGMHWRPPAGAEIECNIISSSMLYPATSRSQSIRRHLLQAVVSRARHILPTTIDAVGYQMTRRRRAPLSARLRCLPETLGAIEPLAKIEARRRLSIPADGRYIAMPGMIDERKGSDTLIRAFLAAPLGEDDRLLLAGRVSPTIQQIIDQEAAHLVRSGRLIVLDGFLPDETIDAVVSAADVVTLLYRPGRPGPSNVVVRAACCNRPVLCSKFAWAQEFVRLFGLGRLAEGTTPDQLGAEIAAALTEAPSYSRASSAARLLEFLRIENFQAAWTYRLACRIGAKPPQSRSWEWVLDPDSGITARP